MAVRTYRGDYAPIGQFGWDDGAGTTAYADPDNQLTGILLTQVGMSTPDSARPIHDFWTTLLADNHAGVNGGGGLRRGVGWARP